MAELVTIARPYAEAAFGIARDRQALPAWSDMLRLGATIVGDPRVSAALDHPRLSAGDKESLVLSIAGDRFDADARSFVRVLIEADRIALLPQIRTLFDALRDQAENVAKATIETAFPLSDAQVDELKTALEKRFGSRIEATVVENRALIGGARVTVGDSVIDGSVQAKLEAMSNRLRG
jgi:F-type H+-transporting ATPase subunit delta